MRYFLLLLPLLCLPLAAMAEERVVPESRTQAMLSFSPVVKKVTPAVVNIYTKRREQVQTGISPLFADPFFNQFFGGQMGMQGMPRERVVASLGSGVIIDARGVVITSNHVITGSDDIVVVLADRREFKAKVVVADPSSDLALLKLNSEANQLPALPVVDSDKVEVGDLVLAVGNPFGVGQTVTSGIVSALSRSAKGVSDYDFFIQTDAAINPGNSGGALVNMQGELIGINTAIYSKTGGSLGIGFAIPSNMVSALIRNTQADGTVLRPWLGAAYQDVTPEIAESIGLPKPAGVLIAKVAKGSPADAAGLRSGDVIVKMNDTAIADMQELKFRIHTGKTDSASHFSILREGKTLEKDVQLAAPPEQPARDARVLKGNQPLTGLTVVNLSPRTAIELGLDSEAEGVAVAAAAQNSPLGLQKGDIITQVNKTRITSTKQLEFLMHDRNYGWKIVFLRGGREMGISVQR